MVIAHGQTCPRHRCVNESFKRCDAGTLLLSSCRFHRLCPACLTCWSRCFPYTWLHNAHNDDGQSHNSSLFQAQRIVRGKFAKTIFRQIACVRMMRRMSELQWVHAALQHTSVRCHHRKKIQSIWSDAKAHDFIAEVVAAVDFLISYSLPKRGKRKQKECMETSAGHKLLMSGGDGHSGIGICIFHTRFAMRFFLDVFTDLPATMANKSSYAAASFPRDTDDWVKELYSLLKMRDFNARIIKNSCPIGCDVVACRLHGTKNERGSALTRWVTSTMRMGEPLLTTWLEW